MSFEVVCLVWCRGAAIIDVAVKLITVSSARPCIYSISFGCLGILIYSVEEVWIPVPIGMLIDL